MNSGWRGQKKNGNEPATSRSEWDPAEIDEPARLQTCEVENHAGTNYGAKGLAPSLDETLWEQASASMQSRFRARLTTNYIKMYGYARLQLNTCGGGHVKSRNPKAG